MWEDIKSWILYLYASTGLVFGIVTLTKVDADTTLSIFGKITYVTICMFAWLPITIVGVLLDTMNF